jgi:hypothetical protein
MCRLVNALASFKFGRDYMASANNQRKLLTALTQAARTHVLNEPATANCIAALQKLSLRWGGYLLSCSMQLTTFLCFVGSG